MSLKSAHTAKIGKAFKNARLRLSLTEEEVANQTLINLEFIKAIEIGDYAIFPARLFAIQYFNKYAKFLNLKIAFYDIYNAEVVAEAEKDSESHLPDRLAFKQNVFFIFFVSTLLLLLIIIAFYHNVDSSQHSKSQLKLSNIQPLPGEKNMQAALDQGINKLHDEINLFFIQDKLDSIHVDVNVNLLKPEE